MRVFNSKENHICEALCIFEKCEKRTYLNHNQFKII